MMPEGPGDLSGCSLMFKFLWCEWGHEQGCVVVVVVEACSFILGRSSATSCDPDSFVSRTLVRVIGAREEVVWFFLYFFR